MTNIASKNLYDLLGNDPEQDPDREPEPPTKVADNPVQRSGKRNAGAEGQAGGLAERPARGGRGGRGDQGGPLNNRERQQPDDGVRQDRHPHRTREPGEHRGRGGGERGERGRGRGRGGRGFGGRFQRTDRDDRGNHSGIGEHEKQAAHGWGEEKSGTAEWDDEKAGEAIARAESKNEPGFTPDTSAGDPAFTNGPGAEGELVNEDAAAPEPEDNTKSYDQYLAEQAEKRQALGGDSLQVRKPNEGSKQKFPEGTAVARNPEQENFIQGSGGKARREKVNQQKKDHVQLDGQYYAPLESGGGGGDRGGRGGRGRGRGRGEFRGERGDRGDRGGRGDRGERRGRGDFGDRGDRGDRGGRGGRGRGEFRGGSRGDRGGPRGGGEGGGRGGFNANDQSDFPALGGS